MTKKRLFQIDGIDGTSKKTHRNDVEKKYLNFKKLVPENEDRERKSIFLIR